MEALLYLLAGLAGIGLLGFLYFENKSIVTRNYVLGYEFLPKEFDGFTITHLSDLHSKWFGSDQQHLVFEVEKARPDIIAITGDMVDSLLFKEDPVITLVERLKDIAPIYCVSGNHEWESGRYEPLRNKLIELGAHLLENRSETIMRGDRMLTIAGIDDPARYGDKLEQRGWIDTMRHYTGQRAQDIHRVIHRELDAVRQGVDERAFKLLLVHRPEWLKDYMEYHFNLILSGHAHGGQWNLPGVGPILAPGQGLFPKLVSGVHKRHGTYMVVSRGLGNSGILAFQRLFNRPEVISVVLKKIT